MDAERGILVATNVLFSVFGSLGNICVCCAFLLYPQLRNSMNIFIFSLACSDLLVCLVAQPMYVVKLLDSIPKEQTSVCEDIRKRLTWVSLLASIGNLVGVTFDRYLIISNPLLYAVRGATKKTCLLVALIWIVSSVMGSITESYRYAKVIGQIYVIVLLVGITIPLYCRILCIARKHARVIDTCLSQVHVNYTEQTTKPEWVRSMSVQKADRNSLKTVGIISGIFAVGWFPLLILPFLYRAGTHEQTVLVRALRWANTLALCSSACNPVVYSWRDRRFRKALTTTYGRWKARRSISMSINDSPTTGCSDAVEMRNFARTPENDKTES